MSWREESKPRYDRQVRSVGGEPRYLRLWVPRADGRGRGEKKKVRRNSFEICDDQMQKYDRNLSYQQEEATGGKDFSYLLPIHGNDVGGFRK